jgi:L-fuculose-phosphate aldolase
LSALAWQLDASGLSADVGSSELDQRQQLVTVARRLNTSGLNQGTSGNLSLRIPGGLLITPSSLPFEQMEWADLVAIDPQGRLLRDPAASGRRRPSSEWRLHADILASRPEIHAVLHCHATHATALACHGRAIPPFHYMTAVAGGDDIPCAPYATFGTAELSRLAVQALEGRLACLLAQHGLVTLGRDLDQALRIAIELETLARMYLQALQLGEPPLLSPEQMAAVHRQFRSLHYGEPAAPDQVPGA